MVLRRLQRLRRMFSPVLVFALLALGARLGWAHDPTCPHHAAHQATTTHHGVHHGHGMPQPESGDSQCRCLDPACHPAGGPAVLAVSANATVTAEKLIPVSAVSPAPESVTVPGAYVSHRLPFAQAPPRFGGLS